MTDEGIAGRLAFVGGGASGIGLACARRLAEAGASVIVADIDGDGARHVAAELPNARGIALDVADAAAVEAAFAGIAAQEGAVRLAVNSVGIAGTGQATADYDVDGWRRIHDVNLHGTFHCMKHQMAMMRAAGGGAIVNIASVMALNGWPNNAGYCSTKHALIGLTKAAALEHAAEGVRVSALCPGFIDTPLLRSAAGDIIDQIVERHPVRRLGRPEEVADFALFLLSDRAAFVTGSAHLIDGGYSAR